MIIVFLGDWKMQFRFHLSRREWILVRSEFRTKEDQKEKRRTIGFFNLLNINYMRNIGSEREREMVSLDGWVELSSSDVEWTNTQVVKFNDAQWQMLNFEGRNEVMNRL